jgi:malate dehydrogenase (oxaloacetate-decarboxylating)(NADP+)
VVAAAYAARDLAFGPEYLIPKPFDPRLIDARSRRRWPGAPMESGVATRPIADMTPTARSCNASSTTPACHEAGVRRGQEGAARVVYAEGEDERVLRAVQVVVDEGLARPILIGRPE